MSLIAAIDLDALPMEPGVRWLQLRDTVATRLDKSREFEQARPVSLMNEYVEILPTAAENLGFGYRDKRSPGTVVVEFDLFYGRVTTLVISHSPRRPAVQTDGFVNLPGPVRARLDGEVLRLREIISMSDLDCHQALKLSKLLDMFAARIDADIINLGLVQKILADYAYDLYGTTSFRSAAPTAIAAIAQPADRQPEAADHKVGQLNLQQAAVIVELISPQMPLQAPSDRELTQNDT
jgi:hypothetical protein